MLYHFTKIQIFVIFFLILFKISYANAPDSSGGYTLFRIESDKNYIGFLDDRSFVTRIFLNNNFDLENAFTAIAPTTKFDFDNVLVSINAKLATEVSFFRNDYVSVGFGGAMDILMYGTKEFSFYTYDFQGDAAAFIDLWLDKLVNLNMKIRIYPVYHQSGHFVDGFLDGFIGSFTQGSSYEFFGLNVYYYHKFGKNSITSYGGVEATYRHFWGNGTPLFRGFVGLDYRYRLSDSKDISFIASMNAAYIYDYQDRNNLLTNRHSISFTVAAGVEIGNVVTTIKYYYGRPRTVTTYHIEQSMLGLDVAVIF